MQGRQAGGGLQEADVTRGWTGWAWLGAWLEAVRRASRLLPAAGSPGMGCPCTDSLCKATSVFPATSPQALGVLAPNRQGWAQMGGGAGSSRSCYHSGLWCVILL